MPITTTFASASARGYGYAGYVVNATITSFTVNGANVATASVAVGQSTNLAFSTSNAGNDVKLSVPSDIFGSNTPRDIKLDVASGSISIVPSLTATNNDICVSGQIFYIASLGGVLRSSDGISWKEVYLPGAATTPTNVVLTDSTGNLVVGGENSKVWISSSGGDLNNWTTPSSGLPASNFIHFRAGAWGATASSSSMFLVAGTNGNAYYSTNSGASWAKSQVIPLAFSQYDLTAVAYGNHPTLGHRWIIAQANTGNRVYYTSDPASGASGWTQGTGFPGANIVVNLLTYGNGVFLAANTNDGTCQLYRSTDGGANWTSSGNISGASDNSGYNILGLKYVDGYFVAIGSAGRWYYSLTGLSGSWYSGNQQTFYRSYAMAHKSNTNTYCIVGENGGITTFTGSISASGGLTRRSGSLSNAPPKLAWNKGTNYAGITGNEYVAVGNQGGILFSDDGIKWTPAGLVPNSMVQYYSYLHPFNDVIWTTGNFIAVSNAGTIKQSRLPNTEPFGTVASPTFSDLYSVGYSGNKLIAGGAGAGTFNNSNGSGLWASTALPLGGTINGANTTLKGIAHTWMSDSTIVGSAGIWVAVGSTTNIANASPIAYSSDNGVTWTRTTNNITDTDFRSVAYGKTNPTRWVAVGYSVNTGGPMLYYSSDQNATTWTRATIPVPNSTGYPLICVRWVINKFFAVGSGGIILTSTDGINWINMSAYSADGTDVSYTGISEGHNNTVVLAGLSGGWAKIYVHDVNNLNCTRYQFDPVRSNNVNINGSNREYSLTLKIPGTQSTKTITM